MTEDDRQRAESYFFLAITNDFIRSDYMANQMAKILKENNWPWDCLYLSKAWSLYKDKHRKRQIASKIKPRLTAADFILLQKMKISL